MTARGWRRFGFSPFRKNPPNTYTKTGGCQDSEENLGRKWQGHRDAEGPVTGKNPRVDRDLGAGQGWKRGEQPGTVMAADSGTRCGALGQAAEADGRRLTGGG